MMERARRVAELWSYLPSFRVAAETEHLPSAGRALFLSPSAVSRSVKALESTLGVTLFDRVGRRMQLNPRGRVLLGAVRDAMRRVEETSSGLGRDEVEGEVTVAAPRELFGVLVWPALASVIAEHPRLLPRGSVLDATHVRELLLRGEIDVALTDRAPAAARELAIERVIRVAHGVFAPPDHPLVDREGLEVEEVARYRFAVSAPRAGDVVPSDLWPPEIPRAELVSVPDPGMAADACARLGLLAVLPDLVGRSHPTGLERLDLELGPRAFTELYAVTRAPVGQHVRTEAALSALGAEARRIAGKR